MDLKAGLVRTALNGTARVAPRLAGRWAIDLFSNPRSRVAVKPAEEPVMRRAERGELTVNGKTVAVYRWGTGERPVLLMHGWMSRASRWSPLVHALTERGYSPVAFDGPGHGESGGRGSDVVEFRDIARRLQAEHGTFTALIGHSIGGLSAFFALHGGVAADRLVSLAAPADFDYLVQGFRAGAGLGPWAAAELRRRIEHELFPGETDAWARLSATYRPTRLTLPIMIVHDESDDVIGRDQSDRVIAAFGGQADLLVTKGLGHRRVLADPQVIEAVLDFASATDPVG
ncbi:alpha/beta hydrolase [Streptomyces sp. NBC_01803]|uniref:alpha/beta hydrolase n=1 Tax=Streptomyces sp. NBC_01803 TaxID=2975946 RepID=UPI002DDC1847|nr:alpha/beta fold hydrolase [Streptomyces sp. NBC_01803]WSA42900.1 alpha/beta fold hydrolase [Streptomyces sp. NBC_01803]